MKFRTVLNGKLTIKSLPINWDETTFGQLLSLIPIGDDLIKAVGLFTGVDEKIIRVAKVEGIEQIIHTLAFLKTPCPTRIPEKILFYPLPKDLGFETFAQFQDLKDDLAKDKELSPPEQLARYPLYCAVYACRHMSKERTEALQKEFPNEGIEFGQYHWRKAEAMKEEFLNAPAPEVLGIGNFTLVKLIGLNLNITPNYHKPITRVKRLKLVLKRLLLRSGLLEPWITWQRKRELVKMNSLSGQSIDSTGG